MEEDLGLVGDQYQVAVSILFVTYCVCSDYIKLEDEWGSNVA